MGLKEKMRALPTRALTVLGEPVEVRGLSAAALIDLEGTVKKGPDGKNDQKDFLARLIVASTYDAQCPLFSEADVPWLKEEANGAAVRQLFAAAAELNGLVDEEGPGKNGQTAG